MTSDMVTRMKDHRAGKGSEFCRKYQVRILIYYEMFADIMSAIRREKKLKKWKREWKIALIRKRNPEMKDLLEKRKQSLTPE